MRNRSLRALCALSLLLLCANPLRAEREVGFRYVTYTDNNQATVATQDIDLAIDVTPKTRLTFAQVIDGISAASRRIPLIDGVSAATPHAAPDRTEYRRDYALGIIQKLGLNNTVSLMGDTSGEDDYSSLSYFLSWTTEFDNRNKAVSLSYSDYTDKLFPFGVTWTDNKYTKSLDVGFTNVFTGRSQGRAVLSYARDDGYLSNPYHRVIIDNYYFIERHPAVRDKAALGLFYTLGFEGERISSMLFDYRYYYDSWDVRSHTGGVKYNRYLANALMGSLRLRYYTQNAASFYKNVYPQEERFMTADTKLAGFSALLYGLGLQYEVLGGLIMELTWEQYAQFSDIDYSHVYQSVAKSDLISQVIYVSARLRL